VHVRVAPELKEAMKDYCKRHHTNLSELVSRFFVRLIQKELEDQNPPDAEQI
jgi:hypothetical protein